MKKITAVLSCAGLFVIGAAVCLVCGRRGFLPLEQQPLVQHPIGNAFLILERQN